MLAERAEAVHLWVTAKLAQKMEWPFFSLQKYNGFHFLVSELWYDIIIILL